ncbi:MAG: glutathione S-transferase family protein [Gaiella sp.]
MLRLHYRSGSAAMAPHAALAEIGVPFELSPVERGNPSAAYLRLNPAGRVPTLEDGELVLTESAAILLHLGERFPEAELLPGDPGSHERACCYRALVHLTNTVQPALMRMYYPERYGTAGVADLAIEELGTEFERLDSALAGGEWLVGSRRSVADLFLFMLTDWACEEPLRACDRAGLRAHYIRCLELPGVRRMVAEQKLEIPSFCGG